MQHVSVMSACFSASVRIYIDHEIDTADFLGFFTMVLSEMIRNDEIIGLIVLRQ